jgi:hydroxymethyl cephem carbamoyltransferase
MLMLAFNPGHDGALAIIQDRKLLVSIESEKDSSHRHKPVTPMTILRAAELIDELPDLIAMGGWYRDGYGPSSVGAGYDGSLPGVEQEIKLGNRRVRFFTSSHVRSHILMGSGMGPRLEPSQSAVLVWEGREGSFYLLDERWSIIRRIDVLINPGVRYAYLFAIADPTYSDDQVAPRLSDSGKLMALAAYGNANTTDDAVTDIVDRLLQPEFNLLPPQKPQYKDSPLYNIGVEADLTKDAAALLTKRLFDMFARVAIEQLPRDIPLYISGGCGLNCDWNRAWRDLGHFSSVFVPPCTNDSGSAIGTAIDALTVTTGEPYIDWDVYCGLEFENDSQPDLKKWVEQPLDLDLLARELADRRIVAWVQGRWEMGPRALGNRSLLAEPFRGASRNRLNRIKEREAYRPIAPCCRLEDAGRFFDQAFEDPYMLYFRMVTDPRLQAIKHVDRSARVQTVTPLTNQRLHSLLSAFAALTGVGVLCNTSLNYKGLGFINRMSDLTDYCQRRGIHDFVVGDTWYRRRGT